MNGLTRSSQSGHAQSFNCSVPDHPSANLKKKSLGVRTVAPWRRPGKCAKGKKMECGQCRVRVRGGLGNLRVVLNKPKLQPQYCLFRLVVNSVNFHLSMEMLHKSCESLDE